MTIILGFAIMFVTLPSIANHLLSMSDHMLQVIRLFVQPGGTA